MHLNSGKTFTLRSLFSMLLNLVINCHYSKFQTPNNSSALEQSAFIENAINDLIRQGCVTEVFGQPIITNPLSVSIQKSGKASYFRLSSC